MESAHGSLRMDSPAQEALVIRELPHCVTWLICQVQLTEYVRRHVHHGTQLD